MRIGTGVAPGLPVAAVVTVDRAPVLAGGLGELWLAAACREEPHEASPTAARARITARRYMGPECIDWGGLRPALAKRTPMLLKNRAPAIDCRSVKPAQGLEHLKDEWIAILRWLRASEVEFVLIGAVADAIRGNAGARGPVAIVPAPYRRNLERLARALSSQHVRLRSDAQAGIENAALKLTAEKLAQQAHWMLRCGTHDIDVEGGVRAADERPGIPSYQELLYEAGRFEPESGLAVDVASPEDIEHFAHLRRTGMAPEMKITRREQVPEEPAEQRDSA